MGDMPTPSVPVSWGELLDKMTILQIKQERIATPAARDNVGREYRLLSAIGGQALRDGAVGGLVESLKRVNEALWEIEDAIRGEEAAARRSEEHTSELQSLMRIPYAVFCLKK